MLYAVIFLGAMLAGTVQTVTGFGAGIVMMLFLPSFFPVLHASALSSSMMLALVFAVAWRYRQHIRFRLAVLPAVFYLATSTAALVFAPYIPTGLLMRIFGGFLLALAVYFLAFPNKLEVSPSLLSASLCAGLSGVTGGLFGIGGPPMVIYFLAATKGKKEEYLGTIQFFFCITNIYTCALRVARGIYVAELIPYTLLGMAAISIGKSIGVKIIDRIDGEMMKKLIYIFLGISGLLKLVG